jgi:hypothetical protein
MTANASGAAAAGVVGRPGLFAGFRKAGEGDIK